MTFRALGPAFEALHQRAPFYPTTSFTGTSLQRASRSADQSPVAGTPGRCQRHQPAARAQVVWRHTHTSEAPPTLQKPRPRPEAPPTRQKAPPTGSSCPGPPPPVCWPHPGLFDFSWTSLIPGVPPSGFWQPLPFASLNGDSSMTCLRPVSQVAGQPSAGGAVFLFERITACLQDVFKDCSLMHYPRAPT